VQLDPLLELLAKSGGRYAREPDSTRLASRLELLGGKGIDALGEDHLIISFSPHLAELGKSTHHVVDSDLLELVSDVLLQEVVRSPSIDVHVPAHGNKLGSRQVV